MFYICIILIKTKTKMITRLEQLEERILVLEKLLLKYPLQSEEMNKEERVLIQILIETKKEYKLQMYQD